jgi:hypothetical protein
MSSSSDMLHILLREQEVDCLKPLLWPALFLIKRDIPQSLDVAPDMMVARCKSPVYFFSCYQKYFATDNYNHALYKNS